MVIREKFYTAEEFWEIAHLPEFVDKRLELIEGEIQEMSPAGGEHGEVGGDLFGFIWNHVRQNGLGRVTAAETGYILFKDPDGKDTVRAPDVGFVSSERAPQPFTEKYIPMAPDLAVEVVSPGDSADEIETKVTQYLRYGVRMVIVVYPTTKTVLVHTPTGLKRLTIEDTLDGGDVLPGFTLKVREIFPT
jgi:Uma2 family endonuclease